MKTGISYTDWVAWLAFELTFVELYQSATTPSQKQEMKATLRRLAEGIDAAAVDAFVSQVRNFEQALSCYSSEEQEAFVDQFKMAVTEFAEFLASVAEKRD